MAYEHPMDNTFECEDSVTPQPAPEKELATTAYTLGRGHTCSKCEHSNVPCTEKAQPDAVPALPERIVPSELDAEELWERNGPYVAAAAYDELLAQLQSANERAAHWARENSEKQKLFDEAIAQRDAANERAERAEVVLRELKAFRGVWLHDAECFSIDGSKPCVCGRERLHRLIDDALEARLAQPELKAEGFEAWARKEGFSCEATPASWTAAKLAWTAALHTKSGLGEDEL
jgi:hypothetical protein